MAKLNDELDEIQNKITELKKQVNDFFRNSEQIIAMHKPMTIAYPLNPDGTAQVCSICSSNGSHEAFPCMTVRVLTRGFTY